MVVYRLTRQNWAGDLSGKGASMYPGRWNHQGKPVLYTSENEATALLENLVYLPALIIPRLVLVTLEIPEDNILH